MGDEARRPQEEEGVARFARALGAVEARLDWELLGRLYCHEGGEAFFPPEQVDALRDAGLALAADLGQALEELAGGGAPAPDASLYVGAAVAELVPILFEVLVLGREVCAVNLEGEETRHLNAALSAAGEELGLPLPPIETRPLAELAAAGAFSHVWITSVLTDPIEFPALHARLYGRGEPSPADEASERTRAGELIEELLGAAARPALVTTTDEELALLLPACRARGASLRVPERARLSAVVGDPVRLCVLDDDQDEG